MKWQLVELRYSGGIFPDNNFRAKGGSGAKMSKKKARQRALAGENMAPDLGDDGAGANPLVGGGNRVIIEDGAMAGV